MLTLRAARFLLPQWTVENIARQGDLIVLLHVVPASETAAGDDIFDDELVPVYAIPLSDPAKVEALTNAALEEAEELMLSLAALCKENGAPCETIVAIEKVYGPVSDAVARIADAMGAAMVVVASTGKGWLKKLWAGSTSSALAGDKSVRAVVVLHGTVEGLAPEPAPAPAADTATGRMSA